jgi:tetratricopeptide (TPR) repeat protein
MIAHRVVRTVGILLLIIFIAACAETVKDRTKEGRASRNLGEAYLRNGNYSMALRHLLKAESILPQDYYLQNDLGLAYMGLKKYDKAIRHFKNALDLKPDYAPAMNSLGNAYARQKRWDSAIEYYKKATQNPLYATPHLPLSNLGALYYELQNYERSERYYLEALDLQPEFVMALRGLSRTYVAMGRISEAISRLKKAIRIAPKLAVLHYDLGKAYQLTGDSEKAIMAFQQVMNLAPESPVADRAEIELNRMQ